MQSINSLKAVVVASALGLTTFFAGNAFAIPSCGACVVGAQPASHTFVTATTNCASCHTVTQTTTTTAPTTTTTAPTTTTTAPTTTTTAPTTTTTASTGSISVRRTSESCGLCQIGTAPSSVSAHKNVNATGTACYTCHSSGSTSVASSGSGSRTSTRGESEDDHYASTSSASSSSSYGRSGDRRRGGSKGRQGHDD
jgi:hypothetical protein